MLCESIFGQVDPAGRRAKVYTDMAKSFPRYRKVTLPSKASVPARRVALLVPAEPKSVFRIETIQRVFQRNVRKVGSPRVSRS